MMSLKSFRGVARVSWILRVECLCALGASVLLAACATGDYVYATTTAYGEKLRIPLAHGAPELAKQGSIQVLQARLLPVPETNTKRVFYYFEFVDSSGATPRSVRVEDVTDDKPMVIIDEPNPQLVKQHWGGKSPPLAGTHPWLGWVHYLDDSVRVFRFTIVKADGQQVILNQAWSVPNWSKVGMRKTLEIE
jgi:hypothetical protein